MNTLQAIKKRIDKLYPEPKVTGFQKRVVDGVECYVDDTDGKCMSVDMIEDLQA